MRDLARKVRCRYVKRDNKLKSSNFEFDLDSISAYSYDWWKFVTIYKGKIIFNNKQC